jgi:hypothetical protein
MQLNKTNLDTYTKAATKKTPKVIFDSKKGYFEISGIAMPEDTVLFFNPLIKTMRENLDATEVPINFYFDIYYFNSLSSKKLYEIFNVIDEYAKNGKDITITWNYEEDDECMEDAGILFKENTKVPFNIVKITD